jgi:hypothetical protein
MGERKNGDSADFALRLRVLLVWGCFVVESKPRGLEDRGYRNWLGHMARFVG